jgi:hypothetical protein
VCNRVSGDVLCATRTEKLSGNSVIEAEFTELFSLPESSRTFLDMLISFDCILIILSIDRDCSTVFGIRWCIELYIPPERSSELPVIKSAGLIFECYV